jgi:hypothetical protein
MKTTFFKSVYVFCTLVFAFTLQSCSQNEDEIIATKKENSFLRNEGNVPPTPVAFEGLFDIQLSNGVKANLLFEFPNKVIYGSPTVTNMMTQPLCKTTYTSSLLYNFFTINDGFTTYNFKCQFNAVTGDLENGQYGIGVGYSDGTFTGTKYMPVGVGENLFKGYWKGKYGNGLAVPTNDYTMALEEDGKFTVAANPTIYNSSAAVGNYTLSGNIFKGTYTYFSGGQYSCKGTYNAATKQITGTWGVGSSYTNGGTFYLDMQNQM